ncbi:MAG: hypothetical protein U0528_14320 [Anaerolineae bacterium]
MPVLPITAQGGIIPRLLTIGGVIAAVVVIGTIFLLLRNRDNGGNLPVLTLTLPAGTSDPAGVAAATDEATSTEIPATETPTVTATEPEVLVPTATLLPTDTLAPTATETPTDAPTDAGLVPTPTIPVTPTTPPPATNTPNVAPTTTPLSGGIMPGTAIAATAAAFVPPTAAPEATTGTYDLLALLETLPAEQINWDQTWFAIGAKGWQLGNADTRRGTAPTILIGTDILTELLGTDAPSYLKRVDATIELVNYSPLLLQNNRVFFGIGLETAAAPRLRADARARLATENTLDLGVVASGNFRKSTTVPVTTVSVRLSIERNQDRTISMYYNGRLLGTTDDVFAIGSPLVIYLYTATGGIIANVTELTVTIER